MVAPAADKVLRMPIPIPVLLPTQGGCGKMRTVKAAKAIRTKKKDGESGESGESGKAMRTKK